MKIYIQIKKLLRESDYICYKLLLEIILIITLDFGHYVCH